MNYRHLLGILGSMSETELDFEVKVQSDDSLYVVSLVEFYKDDLDDEDAELFLHINEE